MTDKCPAFGWHKMRFIREKGRGHYDNGILSSASKYSIQAKKGLKVSGTATATAVEPSALLQRPSRSHDIKPLNSARL